MVNFEVPRIEYLVSLAIHKTKPRVVQHHQNPSKSSWSHLGSNWQIIMDFYYYEYLFVYFACKGNTWGIFDDLVSFSSSRETISQLGIKFLEPILRFLISISALTQHISFWPILKCMKKCFSDPPICTHKKNLNHEPT